MPRIYEYRLPYLQFGRNAPELCYKRENNRIELYHDTAPRLHIATILYGDSGWTYNTHTDKLPAQRMGDNFAGWRQALWRAASWYASQIVREHMLATVPHLQIKANDVK